VSPPRSPRSARVGARAPQGDSQDRSARRRCRSGRGARSPARRRSRLPRRLRTRRQSLRNVARELQLPAAREGGEHRCRSGYVYSERALLGGPTFARITRSAGTSLSWSSGRQGKTRAGARARSPRPAVRNRPRRGQRPGMRGGEPPRDQGLHHEPRAQPGPRPRARAQKLPREKGEEFAIAPRQAAHHGVAVEVPFAIRRVPSAIATAERTRRAWR